MKEGENIKLIVYPAITMSDRSPTQDKSGIERPKYRILEGRPKKSLSSRKQGTSQPRSQGLSSSRPL